jgi:hypothetical protein
MKKWKLKLNSFPTATPTHFLVLSYSSCFQKKKTKLILDGCNSFRGSKSLWVQSKEPTLQPQALFLCSIDPEVDLILLLTALLYKTSTRRFLMDTYYICQSVPGQLATKTNQNNSHSPISIREIKHKSKALLPRMQPIAKETKVFQPGGHLSWFWKTDKCAVATQVTTAVLKTSRLKSDQSDQFLFRTTWTSQAILLRVQKEGLFFFFRKDTSKFYVLPIRSGFEI